MLSIPPPSAPRGAAGDTHLRGHSRVPAAGPQQTRAVPFPPPTRCPRRTLCGTAPVPGIRPHTEAPLQCWDHAQGSPDHRRVWTPGPPVIPPGEGRSPCLCLLENLPAAPLLALPTHPIESPYPGVTIPRVGCGYPHPCLPLTCCWCPVTDLSPPPRCLRPQNPLLPARLWMRRRRRLLRQLHPSTLLLSQTARARSPPQKPSG